MPGLGPPPKPHPLGHGRQGRQLQVLLPDGAVRGPELPVPGPDGGGWCAPTQAWWRSWRTSGQAQLFTGTDWDALLIAAALHHRMWSEQRLELAGEIRLWVSKLGATPVDRARLRITVDMSMR